MVRARLFALVWLGACAGGAAPAEPPASSGSPAAAPSEAGRRVAVLIESAGYTPATVDAAPGEALTLVFERHDDRNCGEVVAFPATGKRVEVPVGTPVAVDVVAPASGQLAFTCGMGMYEGAVVVASR